MLLNHLVFQSFNYDINRNYCNHIEEYKNWAVKVDKIIKNFKIRISDYSLVVIEIYQKNIIENVGSQKIKNFIERYFIEVKESAEFQIILMKRILRKCIKIVIDSNIYITYCVDSDEHD